MKQAHTVERSMLYGLETPPNQASYDPIVSFGGNADLGTIPGNHNHSQRRCVRVELAEYKVHPGVTSYFTSFLDIMYCERNIE